MFQIWLKSKIMKVVVAVQVCICESDYCGFDFDSWELNILYFHFLALVTRQSVMLSFAIQDAMPQEFGGMWETEESKWGRSVLIAYQETYRIQPEEKKIKNRSKIIN